MHSNSSMVFGTQCPSKFPKLFHSSFASPTNTTSWGLNTQVLPPSCRSVTSPGKQIGSRVLHPAGAPWEMSGRNEWTSLYIERAYSPVNKHGNGKPPSMHRGWWFSQHDQPWSTRSERTVKMTSFEYVWQDIMDAWRVTRYKFGPQLATYKCHYHYQKKIDFEELDSWCFILKMHQQAQNYCIVTQNIGRHWKIEQEKLPQNCHPGTGHSYLEPQPYQWTLPFDHSLMPCFSCQALNKLSDAPVSSLLAICYHNLAVIWQHKTGQVWKLHLTSSLSSGILEDVCMHVCMYACTYVCMYVCMYLRMYVCMHACMHACMYVCM